MPDFGASAEKVSVSSVPHEDASQPIKKRMRANASELRVGTVIEGVVETVMGLEGVIVHIDESGMAGFCLATNDGLLTLMIYEL